jgi:hypothetical protein
MQISDVDLFEAGKPRSIWFDINGLMRAWAPPAKQRARGKRKAKFAASIVTAAMIGCSVTAHAIVEPLQLSLAWPAEQTAASTKHLLLQSIKQLRRLKADWNGHPSPQPIERSISIAEWILPQLPDIVADARAGINGDGHVFLRFRRGDKVAYLTVEPKFMHLLFIEPGQPNLYVDDEQFGGRILPARIKSILEERLKS